LIRTRVLLAVVESDDEDEDAKVDKLAMHRTELAEFEDEAKTLRERERNERSMRLA
jgi:chromatin segregation and condensation protein Rec8/ScpA/Scc1 (kleisin family)